MKNNIGIILIVISLFMLFGFSNADIQEGFHIKLAAFALTVILPFTAGIAIIYSNYIKREQTPENKK